jgi:demethylmenaquinone methyltransferase / 2-methoxy-6-polyprenyl-1,4-benzoquinol methylase
MAPERAAHAPAREEARRFFASTGEDYDGVASWATLGQDGRWRRAALAALPRGRADVLDYACGTGLLSLAAARRCAPGKVVGLDLSSDMLARARTKAAAAGVGNVAFVEGDAESWVPPAQAFDAVLAAYLPKYVDPDRWLPHAARALRPGGALVAYDFTHPPAGVRRAGWEAWWRLLGPALARRAAWAEVAQELPDLVRRSRWLPALLEALPRHGFVDVRVQHRTLGACALVRARRA